jgi:hypothetical protein
MHPRHLAIALFVLCSLAALLLAGLVAWTLKLTLGAALAALAVSALLFGGIAYLHDALRAARWDAGHRLN